MNILRWLNIFRWEPYMFEPRVGDSDDEDRYGYQPYGGANYSDQPDRREKYADGLLRQLARLQIFGTLRDVTVKVDGKEFHSGHRCILSAASSFFERTLTSGFKESDVKEVEIKEMDVNIFEKIFSFMYSGRMDIDNDLAVPLFHAATYLGLRNEERVFMNHFTYGKMSAVRLLSLWPAVKDANMKRLNVQLVKHLLKDFEKIVKSDAFVKRAPSQLIHEYLKLFTKGLTSDDLTEEQLVTCIVRWLKHDWEKRKGHTHWFLKPFRLGLLPRAKVEELMDAQILEIPGCQSIMDDLLEKWRQFEGVEDPLKLPDELLARGMRRTLIAFGGERELTECSNERELEVKELEVFAHFYDNEMSKWSMLTYPEMPGNMWKLEYPSMVVVNWDIYLAGGCDDEEDHSVDGITGRKELFKLDGTSYKWTKLSPMQDPRSQFTLTHHEGYLYAIGGVPVKRRSQRGRRWTGYLDTVERYNVQLQQWDRTYKLPDGLAFTSAVVLDGKIIAYGLIDVEDGVGIYQLVGFDPGTQKWVMLLQEEYAIADEARDSVLVVHDGSCYRVRYEKTTAAAIAAAEAAGSTRMLMPYFRSTNNDPKGNDPKYQAHVRRINLNGGNVGVRAGIGDEVVSQGRLASFPSEAARFHIDGHIYIKVGMCVHKTGEVIGESDLESTYSDLNGWRECKTFKTNKAVVEYVFDTKKML